VEDDPVSLEQYYLRMVADGYTSGDIIDFLSDADSEAVDTYAEEYISDHPEKFDLDAYDAGSGSGSTAAEYTLLYPDLYAEAPTEFTEADNTVYLTFDDGPSENTLDILNILDKYNIKATFFMSGGESDRAKELMKAVADKGHTIGIHSISHEYEDIYQSVETFLADLNETYNCIYEATGVKPQIIRFAGGSINNYNRLIYPQLIAEVTRRGFVYYDWNVSGEDATTHATWTSIYENVLNGISETSTGRAIVLLHDSADKQLTVSTVEDIITKLLDEGYTFDALDHNVKPITFSYVD
jgi:peptidoglycan/xylan/chitin deacetylase (PgdA/CDA1 family)